MTAWASSNGLIVPERLSLAKRLEAANKVNKGKFFSNYTMMSGMAGLGHEKPGMTLNFETLKKMRRESIIDSVIINARVTQTMQMAKRVIVPGKQTGYRVVHEKSGEPNLKPYKNNHTRVKEVETN